MSVLVTGGAGYIGSHVAHALIDRGESVVAIDDLSTGVRELVPSEATFYEGRADDVDLLRRILTEHGVDAVLHFAGSTVVPESIVDPLTYYANNTVATHALLTEAKRAGVGAFVFSSTAAVYGQVPPEPVGEDHVPAPITPYGRSKLFSEHILADTVHAGGPPFVALRYFNVAGADPKGRTGQSTPRATHLIKVACEVTAGKREYLEVLGSDYDTPDGTCVRDFIHVSDLADVHLVALDHLRGGGRSLILNCGYGHGYSVREVVQALERISGCAVPTVDRPRREGDLVSVVARTTALSEAFGWTPSHASLDTILETALRWELRSAPSREHSAELADP